MEKASLIPNRCGRADVSVPRLFHFALTLLICSLAFIGQAWAPTFYEYRHEIFEKSFDKVLCLAEFQNRIFVGVGHDDSAKIYRLCHDGCKIWEDVTPLWRADTDGDMMAMAVFDNALFVGTAQGEVFATLDGLKWYNVSGSLPSTISVSDMAVFNGYLYLSSAWISIWRSADGLIWEPVVGPSPALHPVKFGNTKNHDLNSIEVFNGYLYAGVGRDNINGIQIWRTANGVNWTLFHELVQPDPPDPLPAWLPGHVHAMAVFNNKLYIGEYEGQGLFRTDGSAASWEYLSDPVVVGHGVLRLAEHAGLLYLGNYDLYTNTYLNEKLLYQSADGSSWAAVLGSPIVSQDTNGIGALLSAGGKLYAGTFSAKSFTSDPTARVQVYEMGWGPQLTCALADVKKTIFALKARFVDIANLASWCNPPPAWVSPPSSCFLLVGGYGQAVVPTSESWVYSAIDEIKTALQDQVWPRDETIIQKKLDLLDQINTEFRLAMTNILLAYAFIDSQGAQVVQPLLDDAVSRLKTAQRLCIAASYPSTAPQALPLLLNGGK
jgi:hypothetical protein